MNWSKPTVSYLATWQPGNDKLMACDAHHIPGPDTHQCCTSCFGTLQHSANQSSRAFPDVSKPFLSPLRFSFQHVVTSDMARSENDAMVRMEELKSQQMIPFTSPTAGPSAKEGLHLNVTRGETSSCRAA